MLELSTKPVGFKNEQGVSVQKSEEELADIFLTEDTKEVVEEIEHNYPFYWDDGELKESVFEVAKQTEGILQTKGIDPEDTQVVIATDFDGPVNTHNLDDLSNIPESDQSSINLHPGFEEAWKNIPLHSDIRRPAIVSNRSTTYLQNWLYDLDKEVNYRTVIAGDGGRTHDKKSLEAVPMDKELKPDFADVMLTGEDVSVEEFWEISESLEDKVKFEQYLFRKAAEEERKIVFPRKVAPEIGTINFEDSGIGIDEDSKTGIWEEEFYAEEYGGTTIENIWNVIDDISDEHHSFERPYNGDTIVYEDNFENTLLLNEALNMQPGALKFKKVGENPDRIAFTTYHFTDSDYSRQEAIEELEEVKEEFEQDTDISVELTHNGDGWTDYALDDELKQKSMRQLMERYDSIDNYEDILLFYMGDSPSDLLTDHNNIAFAQEDYPAEEAAPEKGVLYGTAQNSVDYVLGVSDVLKHHKEEI